MGIRKQPDFSENEFTHFRKKLAVFSGALRAPQGQLCWPPVNGGLRLCFILCLQLLRRQTQAFFAQLSFS